MINEKKFANSNLFYEYSKNNNEHSYNELD